MPKYREVLYKNYHSTQSGRRSKSELQQQFTKEKKQFSAEILPLIADLPKNSYMLDIGCGNGSLVQALIEHGFTNIHGIDISEEQIKVAKSLDVHKVECANASEYLQRHDKSWDVIFGMDIIEHFTKDELVEFIFLVKSKLNQDGMAIFRTPNMDAPFASIYAHGDFTHEVFLNASSAKQVFLACGFSKVSVHESSLKIFNPLKEILRKFLWFVYSLKIKFILFSSNRSSQDVILTPNLIIAVHK